jgi:hypothetical protein
MALLIVIAPLRSTPSGIKPSLTPNVSFSSYVAGPRASALSLALP